MWLLIRIDNPSKILESEDALLKSMVIDQEKNLRPRYPL
jgi:hypothetical protein